jgi:hypothetical protein
MMIPDDQVEKILLKEAIKLVSDKQRQELFAENILRMANRNADIRIAEEVLKLAEK